MPLLTTNGELIKYEFFGIAMNSVEDAKNFTITEYYNDSGCKYTYNATMNPNISAKASIEQVMKDSNRGGQFCYSGKCFIWIDNKSNKPISTNYFGDEFSLVMKDGKTYIMEKQSISNYYSKRYINPDSYASFYFPSSTAIFEKVKKGNVEMIVCKLGGLYGTTIVLKPYPEPSNKVKKKEE